MDKEFKTGDVVMLKSGSPDLTIGAFSQRSGFGKTAIVYWFVASSSEIKSMEVYIDALVKKS